MAPTHKRLPNSERNQILGARSRGTLQVSMRTGCGTLHDRLTHPAGLHSALGVEAAASSSAPLQTAKSRQVSALKSVTRFSPTSWDTTVGQEFLGSVIVRGNSRCRSLTLTDTDRTPVSSSCFFAFFSFFPFFRAPSSFQFIPQEFVIDRRLAARRIVR